MDRFEEVYASYLSTFYIIYIPVWIDLKEYSYHLCSKNEIDLHSSMDRFEEVPAYISVLLFLIYIPVWIDLKTIIFNYIIKRFIIYIPVWIDLKFKSAPEL